MRLLSFQKDNCQRIGLIDGTHVLDLNSADPSLPNELIEIMKKKTILNKSNPNFIFSENS